MLRQSSIPPRGRFRRRPGRPSLQASESGDRWVGIHGLSSVPEAHSFYWKAANQPAATGSRPAPTCLRASNFGQSHCFPTALDVEL